LRDLICSSWDTIPACVRRTDGEANKQTHTATANTALA